MYRYLGLLVMGSWVLAAQALEYGSTSLEAARNPGSQIDAYARQLCARADSQPQYQLGLESGYAHIICERQGQKTGDLFARQEGPRLDLNYRLEK